MLNQSAVHFFAVTTLICFFSVMSWGRHCYPYPLCSWTDWVLMLLCLSLQDHVKIFTALEKVFITIHVTTTNSNLFCWDFRWQTSTKQNLTEKQKENDKLFFKHIVNWNLESVMSISIQHQSDLKLLNSSRSVSLAGGHPLCHRLLIRFRSGLWLCHSAELRCICLKSIPL